MAQLERGTLVRFYHERDGGPVRRVASVAPDGMIELEDMGGFFAPHLFEIADDIADIPPSNGYRRASARDRANKLADFWATRDDISLSTDAVFDLEQSFLALILEADRLRAKQTASSPNIEDDIAKVAALIAEIARLRAENEAMLPIVEAVAGAKAHSKIDDKGFARVVLWSGVLDAAEAIVRQSA